MRAVGFSICNAKFDLLSSRKGLIFSGMIVPGVDSICGTVLEVLPSVREEGLGLSSCMQPRRACSYSTVDKCR